MRVERIRDLVARLHARPRRHLTLLVAVDGPAEPGRAVLVAALAAADPGLEVVQMEEFRAPSEGWPPGRDGAAAGRAFDVDWRRLRNQVLLPLSRDRPGRYEVNDAAVGAPGEVREIPVGGIVVVEGVYACLKQLAALYDFRIWVEAPDAEGGVAAYRAEHDPAAGAHLQVDGSGALGHDPWREYVRLRS